MNIFEYKNYVDYLNEMIKSRPRQGHGVRIAMAEAMKCKTGYVSQVLLGKAHFSLEQAYRLNEFFEHSEEEAKYFLLLVNYARAGTNELKSFLKKQIVTEQNKSLQLKKRLNVPQTISDADLAKYFASVENSLVHILTTIPEFQTKSAIKDKLKISSEKLEGVLNFLISLGFVVVESGGRFVCGQQRLHLPDDSPLIVVKHALWRLQAMKALQNSSEFDLHYSSVISVSKDDVVRIKQSLVKEIEKCGVIIKESAAEVPCSLCLDFYEIN